MHKLSSGSITPGLRGAAAREDRQDRGVPPELPSSTCIVASPG